MKPIRLVKGKALRPAKAGFDGLLRELCEFITESRRQVLRAVDVYGAKQMAGLGGSCRRATLAVETCR